jgi:cytochrome c
VSADPSVPSRRKALKCLAYGGAVLKKVVLPCLIAAAANAADGDPGHGKMLYQACQGCHSVDENDLGPRHRGVVGRRAGNIADYNYSAALKDSGLTWDPATLDRWLANPSALVPGTKMFFKLDDPQSRADIIAYLAELK